MFQRTTKLLALLAAIGVGVVACEQTTTTGLPGNQDGPDGPNPYDGPATVSVLLTDAPAAYVAEAWVDIGEVQLLPSDEGKAPITLTDDGTDGMVDLLTLQDQATIQLANQEIEPGDYKQLRLIVEAASVTLIEGYTFRDGSSTMDLKVPSGAQTGIKLNLWPADGMHDGEGMDQDRGVPIIPGETVLIVDFDVNQSFRIQGNPETPAGIKSMHFQPTLRVTVEDVAGSIAGTLTDASETLDSLGGIVVRAEPDGESMVVGYQTTTATTLSKNDGTYKIWFLVPADYLVSVDAPDGYFATPAETAVRVGWVEGTDDVFAEDVTGIDFVLDELGSISGTVTAEADSIPVAGLTVTADGDNGTFTGTTGEDGTYTIEDVMPGDYAVSLAGPEGFAVTPESQDVTVDAGEDVMDVDFALSDPAGSVAGTVTATDDSISVSGLAVTLENGDASVSQSTTTGEDGTYSFGHVPAGDYDVTVDPGEGFIVDPDPASITVGEDEDVTGVDFEVDDPAGSIAGTVSAAADTIEVGSLTVTADDGAGTTYEATTDDEGLYSFDYVAPGEYTVTVGVAEGFVTDPTEATVTVGDNEAVAEVDFTIDEADSGGGS